MPLGGSGVSQYQPKKSVPAGGSFSVSWSMQSSLDNRSSLEDGAIDFWRGDLLWSDASVQDKIIGGIDCVKIGSGDLSPTDYPYVFDCHSADLATFSRVFDEYGDIPTDVRNEVGEGTEISQGTKLYVDRVEVDEEFRGLGLGLYLVDEADLKINDVMSLIVLCPAPLNRRGIDMSEAERKTAVQKLRTYYRLLNFAPLGDVFVARWNGYISPRLINVCSHLFAGS